MTVYKLFIFDYISGTIQKLSDDRVEKSSWIRRRCRPGQRGARKGKGIPTLIAETGFRAHIIYRDTVDDYFINIFLCVETISIFIIIQHAF